MLPLDDLRLEWRPPEQLSCTALIPRQPLGSDPPTHLDIHLNFNLLEAPGCHSDSNRLLLRMGSRAAEGGGGRMRASAEVPQGLLQSIEKSGSGLWRVGVRARLLWQKGSKGDFEHGPQLEAWIVIPCSEVSNGAVSHVIRAGCVGAMQTAARETENSEQANSQTVLRQLLMVWRYMSRGDEATWLDYCGLPEGQAEALLKEWLVEPLESYVHKLQEFLSVDAPASTPAGLWEAWDSGAKTLEAWKLITIQGEALPPANGNVGVALEALQHELEELVAEAWQSIEKPVLEPLQKMSAEVALATPDMETLWRTRGESRAVLAQWVRFRARVALMQDSGDAEAKVGNRLASAVNELRKGLVIAEDALVQDLQAKIEELRNILDRVEASSDTPKVHAAAVQTAIASSQKLLLVWSHQEEYAPAFWKAFDILGMMQLQEANEQLKPQGVWSVWGCGFDAVLAWKMLGQQTNSAGLTENETFRALVDELISLLSGLLIAALQVLPRTLRYPLMFVEEEVGADFGKVYIGGYEALQLCIKNQTRTAFMTTEAGATAKLGSFLVQMAGLLQEQVLAEIHSTSKNLELATAEESREVAELIEALNSLDFNLTRWNFMRPCVANMSMSPGAVGEMMRRLLGLADRVRAARDAKDLQHIRCFISFTNSARTLSGVPARAGAVDVAPGGTMLQAGAEITVGDEYHQVKDAGVAIGLVTRLRGSLDPGAQICRLEVSPLVPLDAVAVGWSQAFLDTVENFQPQLQDSADNIVQKHYGWLPTDVKARKIAVLTMYTVNSLYCEVNRALYENDRNLLWDNAGYICELRDVFLAGQTSSIVEPFIGDVVRSFLHANHKLEELSDRYKPGQAVCWASFTSTSDANELRGRHNENVVIRINCGRMGPPSPGQYFPSLVKAFSAFPSEDEVLFPPHSFFRVINMELVKDSLTLEMETMEFLGIWDMIRGEDWSNFEMWCSRHPEHVDTRARKFSIIGAIAESISKPLERSGMVPNPFDVCMRYGADINEIHKQETPFNILAKKRDGASDMNRPVYAEWLSCLQRHGANQ